MLKSAVVISLDIKDDLQTLWLIRDEPVLEKSSWKEEKCHQCSAADLSVTGSSLFLRFIISLLFSGYLSNGEMDTTWAQPNTEHKPEHILSEFGWELKGDESEKDTERQQRHAERWVCYTACCCPNKSLMEHPHTLARRVWADLTAWGSSTLSANSCTLLGVSLSETHILCRANTHTHTHGDAAQSGKFSNSNKEICGGDLKG